MHEHAKFCRRASPTHNVGDFIVVLLACTSGRLLCGVHGLVALCQLAQARQRVGSQLVDDAWHELRQLLVHTLAVDGMCVCRAEAVD